MVSMEQFASAFGIDTKSDDVWTTLGKVTAVNGDGTLSVMLGGSSSASTCDAYCVASVDDVVFVVITGGRARAIAVRGGNYLPITGGTITGNLSVTGTVTSNEIDFSSPDTEAHFGNKTKSTRISITSANNLRVDSSSDGGASWTTNGYAAQCTQASSGSPYRAANQVLATPNGSDGLPSMRKLVAADIDSETVTTASSIITQTSTQSTDNPVTSASYYRHGAVAMLEISITPAANRSAGTAIDIGTVVSGKRPHQWAFGGSQTIMARMTTGGAIQIVPRGTLGANTQYTIGFTYLL